MFNKAMEVIETREFFGIRPDQIEVLVHPESLVHAMVGFRDKGIIAHIGPHDMRHAIGYALHHPARPSLPLETLDLAKIGQLNFASPDPKRYPALALADETMKTRGLAGAVFNGAKEAALDGFLENRIGFNDMARVVGEVIEIMSPDGLGKAAITLDSVREADQMARRRAVEAMAKR